MAYAQQIAHSLEIERLKGLVALDEIRLDEKPLTAILGPNGCGKSTILHALACCYKPQAENPQENFRFKDFFTPTTDSTWAGSRFTLVHSYRDGQNVHVNQQTVYRKVTERWAPRYETRPDRHLAFLGIRTCVPRIEEETYTSLIRYVTAPHADPAANDIRRSMSLIFNRDYQELNVHQAVGGQRYPGLAYGGTRYSALSMGAGEQRVLQILLQLFNAPRYGLILVDEIDLLLHTRALKELIKILSNRAAEKSLQVVFTTHREAILEMSNLVSIKHIHTIGSKTYCFSNTKPDAIHRLTGAQVRPIEIFLEDDMARAIANHVIASLGMARYVSITEYGSASNCFTMAVGLHLRGEALNNKLFVLDGDVYSTEQERLAQVNKRLTGTEGDADARRQSVLMSICAFAPGPGLASPERKLHQMIRALPRQADAAINEVIDIAAEIEAVDDNHSFISEISIRMNLERPIGLMKIVHVAAISPEWDHYVHELREWLLPWRAELHEHAA